MCLAWAYAELSPTEVGKQRGKQCSDAWGYSWHSLDEQIPYPVVQRLLETFGAWCFNCFKSGRKPNQGIPDGCMAFATSENNPCCRHPKLSYTSCTAIRPDHFGDISSADSRNWEALKANRIHCNYSRRNFARADWFVLCVTARSP